jgi:hypothetical protein
LLKNDRDVDRELYLSHDIQIDVFDLSGAGTGICGDEIDVALNGIGAGLLDFLCIFRPSTQARSIEAGDDGNIHGIAGFANVF